MELDIESEEQTIILIIAALVKGLWHHRDGRPVGRIWGGRLRWAPNGNDASVAETEGSVLSRLRGAEGGEKVGCLGVGCLVGWLVGWLVLDLELIGFACF